MKPKVGSKWTGSGRVYEVLRYISDTQIVCNTSGEGLVGTEETLPFHYDLLVRHYRPAPYIVRDTALAVAVPITVKVEW